MNFIAEVLEERRFFVQWLVDSPFDAGGPLAGVKFQTKVCIAMDTFAHLVRGDSDRFNASLASGLELFRSFHTATPERSEKTEGGGPLSLFALACWGYDSALVDPDFRFEVESGYLPKHILERDWVGAFPL
ncbi:immunity 49 family protein [Nocardiopsis sp. NPDC006938]|uniref:immunity 49 family protein n=1 Tax=Nocardiopsis sp. NPDC006938 TaxID=3364337 RepID=UPI0036B6E81D